MRARYVILVAVGGMLLWFGSAVYGDEPTAPTADFAAPALEQLLATEVTTVCRYPENAFTAAAAPPPAPEPLTSELALKAEFLVNFARFTTWPTNALPAAPAPFVIGVLGTDPFGPVLDRVVAGRQVAGRPVVVRRCAGVAEARDCPLLFIADSEAGRLDELLPVVVELPVVTVSDIASFAAQGGMIELGREKGYITFSINNGAAARAGVTFSSKLLHLARRVLPPPASAKEKH